MASDLPRTLFLREAYAGYAPGTEFLIRRAHKAAVLTCSPIADPLRAITIPAKMMEEQ